MRTHADPVDLEANDVTRTLEFVPWKMEVSFEEVVGLVFAGRMQKHRC